MKKRILALCLVLAMIIGMLPMIALAEDAAGSTGVMIANNGKVTLDGSLSETEWQLGGNLSGETRFGAIYDGDTLYLGVNAAVDGLSVTLNGVAVTAETVKGESSTEAKISMDDANLELYAYNQSASLKVALGDAAWEGTVKFDAVGRTVFTGGGVGTTTGTDGYAGGSNTNGVYNFYANKDGACAETKTESRSYIGLTGNAAQQNSGLIIREFDIVVNAMPSYDISSLNNPGNYMFPGVNFGIFSSNSSANVFSGLCAAISRIEGYTEGYDDLYLLIGNSTQKDHWILPLNRAVGEKFHLRFEFEPDATDLYNDLVVYCDGVQLATLENVQNGKGYTSSSSGYNINAWIKGADNIAKGEVNFTISNVAMTKVTSGNVIDSLTADTILGSNNSAASVSADLTLPAYLEDKILGKVGLTWTSSDTGLIGNDGVVVPDVSGNVTMTAALAANPEITKSFDLTVSCDIVDAAITTETITLDGVLDEHSWAAIGGVNPWMADVLWNNGYAWMAVEVGEADSMSLTLGEKTWELALNETVSADGITGAVKDGVAELQIDLKAAGIALSNYGEKYAFQVVVGETKLADEEISVRFSGKEVSKIDWASPLFSVGGSTNSEGGNISSTGSTSYVVSYPSQPGLAGWEALAGDMYLSTKLTLETLPVVTAQPSFSSATDVSNGLVLWIADCSQTTDKGGQWPNSAGDTAAVKFFNLNGELWVEVLDSTGNATKTAFKLGVELNETFELGLQWVEDDLTVYVNGTALGTASNASVYTSGMGLDVVYFRCGTNGVKGSWSDMYLLADAVHTDVADELTQNVVFSGVVLDHVTGNLPMSSTITTEHLGDVAVRWESSNTQLIANDGTVTVPESGSLSATVSLYLADSSTALWTADVTVVNDTPMMDAVLVTNGITVDGNLNELQWVKWNAISGDVSGSIAATWDKGHVYIAAIADNADILTLVINGNTVTVDLATGTVSGVEGAVIAVNGNNVEMDLPLAAMNIYPADYNDTVDLTVTFSNASASTTSNLEKLRFTGKTANITAVSNTSAGWTFSGSVYNFESVNDTAAHYIFATGNNYSLTESTYITQELYFTSMPVTDGSKYDTYSAKGYYYYASRNCPNYDGDRKGDMFFVSIYNAGDGKLFAKIRENNADPQNSIDLGVSVGDEFRLTTAWHADGSVALYVNGKLAGTSGTGATYTESGMGDNVLTFRYRGTGTNDMVSFRMQNVTVMKTTYTSVKDELNPANTLNRADLERVTNDLPMNSTYSSDYFEAIPISWITSDASVIEADGTIHRGETAKSCQISLVYNGEILWTEDVTVAAADDTDKPSAPKYTTAFANDIVIDGSLVGENWHMANKLLSSDAILVGEMGAAWNLDKLYIAIRNSGNDVALTVNGIKIDLSQVEYAVSGDYIEIAIPMTYLGVAINGYGLEMPVSVTAGEGSYEGTLVLSGTDWWGAGNAEEPLPVLSGNVKSVSLMGGNPDGNQGAVEVTNGWHLYDRYSETGTNPAGVRTYILFMRTSPYENFANRDGTTTVEFDFQALSLPEWDLDESLQTSNTAAFANYGLNWSLADAANTQKYSNVLTGGIVNTKDGLYLVVRGNSTQGIALNKQVGDQFRITMNWNTDNSLDVYVDGELITSVENLAKWCGSVGDTSFVINMIRNENNPESSADDMDVYVTNIAFGSAYSDDPMDTLSWDDIKGENSITTDVEYDLVLPGQLVNEQLGYVYGLTWTSSDPSIIDPETGKVNRPETGATFVTLTATMEDGSTKEFTVVVIGKTIDVGNTLVVSGDTNPAVGSGSKFETALYTFDTNNNSMIEDMLESQTINVVKLTDLDAYSRLNRESLTLWISDDNKTYTQIEDYKLTQVGQYWYLYDFEATGRYVKVHYTHWNGTDADFIAPLANIIDGYYEEVIGSGTGDWLSKDTEYTNTSDKAMRDERVELSKAELGITGEDASIRVYLGDELLYHYVDGDTIYARVPDIAVGETVTLTVKYGTEGAVDLSNKEACFEVTYGTRETYKLTGSARWLLTIPAGTYGEHVVEKEMLIGASGGCIKSGYMVVSYDGGLTWAKLGTVSAEAIAASQGGAKGDTGAGGWIFDEQTGAIFFETHNYKNFDAAWQTSDSVNVIIGSYDMGKTWELIDVIEPDVVDGKTYTYMLSYSDGLVVSSYDGEGPNVDFVFPTGAQYTTNGAFCCRVAYSTDAGKTWQMSKSLLAYGDEKGHEGGLSEGWILENEDHVLVLYSRCQFPDEVNFAKAYSYDFGITWTAYQTREEWEANKDTEGNKITTLISSVYSSNTQALMYEYEQYNGVEAPLFLWGGNNTLGGTSYIRTPLNVAVSYDGLETFRNIQNLFLETYQDVYTLEGRSVITNHSVKKIGEDTLVGTYSRLSHGDSMWLTVSDFENWLYRTKGAYDNFESGNPFYEGWSTYLGIIENTKKLASEGEQSLYIPKLSTVTRSIPYLQNGTISLDVYVTADTAVTFALQPAFGDDPNAYNLTTISIENMKLVCGDTTMDLVEGWNTIEIELELTGSAALISANGGQAAPIALNMDVSDYVCYFTVFSDTEVYIDEFTVVSYLDAEIYTGETQKKEPGADVAEVEEMIDAIGVVTLESEADIQAALNAYNALSDEEKAEVSNADALTAAVDALNWLQTDGNGMYLCSDGQTRYYVDGVPTYAGLIYVDGDYYYVNSQCLVVKDCSYGIGEAKANGLLPAGTYEFDEEGKLIQREGLVVDEDGEIRYYVNFVPTYAGVVKDADGNLYYINSSKKAVKNCTYAIGEGKTNGLVEAGTYEFDADGKMIIVPAEELKNGLCWDEDGEIRYYVDGVATYAGVVQDAEGNYYYINSTKKAVKNCTYGIGAGKTNGLIAAGTYTIDENGVINVPANGLRVDEDGEIRYYVDGVATYAGVVEDADGNLYYINSSKKAVKNCTYGIGSSKTNGLIAAGTYVIDENGHIVVE